MKDADITKITPKRTASKVSPSDTDWSRFDAMPDEEVHRAAMLDPDAQPLTDEDMDRMRRTPRAKIIRRALSLTEEEFSSRYSIPIATLRAWEAGTVEPDEPARAYLRVIASDPEGVEKALRRKVG